MSKKQPNKFSVKYDYWNKWTGWILFTIVVVVFIVAVAWGPNEAVPSN